MNQPINFKEIQPGVFDLTWGTRLIRLIVLSRVPLEAQNAFWLLFSGTDQGFVYGDQHYHWRQPSQRAVLNQLYELYQ